MSVVKIAISVAIGILMISSMGVLCSGRVVDAETRKVMLGYVILNFIMFCSCCVGLYCLWLI